MKDFTITSLNEIVEGNKLIAEFMGGDFKKVDYFGNGDLTDEIIFNQHPSYLINNRKVIGRTFSSFQDLLYHSSWDWLMPVVEKIESLGVNITLVSFQRSGEPRLNSLIIHDVREVSESYTHNITEHESKIYEVWLAVIEFIKWYNSQNNNS